MSSQSRLVSVAGRPNRLGLHESGNAEDGQINHHRHPQNILNNSDSIGFLKPASHLSSTISLGQEIESSSRRYS
jgi:hypothetical protein